MMDKELLMLHGARQAVLQIMAKGSSAFAKKLDDGKWHQVDWADICYLLTDMIEQEPIIDKIRAEIEKQEMWLTSAGYNAYNIDIAFRAIKLALAESEVK